MRQCWNRRVRQGKSVLESGWLLSRRRHMISGETRMLIDSIIQVAFLLLGIPEGLSLCILMATTYNLLPPLPMRPDSEWTSEFFWILFLFRFFCSSQFIGPFCLEPTLNALTCPCSKLSQLEYLDQPNSQVTSRSQHMIKHMTRHQTAQHFDQTSK